jgi:hypothetical protein
LAANLTAAITAVTWLGVAALRLHGMRRTYAVTSIQPVTVGAGEQNEGKKKL